MSVTPFLRVVERIIVAAPSPSDRDFGARRTDGGVFRGSGRAGRRFVADPRGIRARTARGPRPEVRDVPGAEPGRFGRAVRRGGPRASARLPDPRGRVGDRLGHQPDRRAARQAGGTGSAGDALTSGQRTERPVRFWTRPFSRFATPVATMSPSADSSPSDAIHVPPVAT